MPSEPKDPGTMTDPELVEAVATEVMGWGKGKFMKDGVEQRWSWELGWNPLTDWNNWREVEEKIQGDEALAKVFYHPKRWGDVFGYIKSDLRTRCIAALQAVRPLPPTP